MIRIRDSLRIPGRVRVTYGLLVLNVLCFWVAMYEMEFGAVSVIRQGGVIPVEWFGWGEATSVFSDRPPAIITVVWAMFLHGTWLHLIFNCLFLYWFGPNVEARIGAFRFWVFYLACGGAGFLLQVVFDLESEVPIIGASGAISGLLGAYWVWFGDHFMRITIGTRNTGRRELIFPIKALLLLWLLTQVLNSILPDPHNTDNTAYFTHIGGFVCGFLLARSKGRRSARRFKVFEGGKRDAPFTD